MNLDLPEDSRPTQVDHPNRAVGRTAAAVLLGALPVIYPTLAQSVGHESAAVVIGLGIAGSAVVTRLLALPSVESFLRQVIPALAAGQDDDRFKGVRC